MTKHYDPWKPREHRDRPTKERLRRGKWELHDTDIAGVTVARDMSCLWIDKLHQAGILSADQMGAAVDFYELHTRTKVTKQGRSCLNMEPVGHDPEIDEATENAMLAEKELRQELGPRLYWVLVKVCVDNQLQPSMTEAKEGLDRCIKFFRN